MTRTFPRASLNTSRLIRFLNELAVSDAETPPQHLAERLGRFLDFSDAITLSAAHDQLAKRAFEHAPTEKEFVEQEFLQVRNTLVTSIIRSCTQAENARTKLPVIKTQGVFEVAATYDLFHRFYATHQQNIDTSARSLRANLRNAIAGTSPQLQQLVALDAAFDEILWERSRRLFAGIPRLLEKRYLHLFKAHQETLAKQALAKEAQEDDRTRWQQPGGWLDRFCKEMQGLLLAELDVRLQPALGLVEAFSKEVNKHQ